LTWPEGQIEFAITQHALDRHLPRQARVLDIGGGAGRWTIWLATHDHRPTLADISPDLLEIARQKITAFGVDNRVDEVITADATDLSHWPDEAFDAVLCLGPFYHLTEPQGRAKAAREINRVLKTYGIAFVAFMPLYGFLRRTLALKDEQIHLNDEQFMSRLMAEGVFLNDVAGRFNSGYGIRPSEVAPFMANYGFEQLELLSDTGFVGAQAVELAELAKANPQAHERVMKVVLETADDPSNLGASIHMLYIGKKGNAHYE
jgi:SAM-dependent methyltransferase